MDGLDDLLAEAGEARASKTQSIENSVLQAKEAAEASRVRSERREAHLSASKAAVATESSAHVELFVQRLKAFVQRLLDDRVLDKISTG